MESDQKPRPKHNEAEFPEQRAKEIHRVSNRIRGKYSGMIAATAVQLPRSNADALVLTAFVDDMTNTVLGTTLDAIKADVTEFAYEGELEIKGQVMLASDLWAGLKMRDDDILSQVRNSLVIHDTGFFQPLQDLLVTGKVRPSKESMNMYYTKASRSFKTANDHVGKAILDLYWAATDAAHAAVMTAGITPPSPSELPGIIENNLVKRNLVHRRCPEILAGIYAASKKIMHKEQLEFSGREYDHYLADTDFFLKEMKDFVERYAK
jgi:uncharacterized protein (UPF0332 family)